MHLTVNRFKDRGVGPEFVAMASVYQHTFVGGAIGYFVVQFLIINVI